MNVNYNINTQKSSDNYHHGVFNLVSDDNEIINKYINIVVTCDRSGSMAAVFDSVQFSLINLMKYLRVLLHKNPDMVVYLSILMFDHTVEFICKQKLLTKATFTDHEFNSLKKEVELTYARGCTNIENAFKSISECYIDDIILIDADIDADIESFINVNIFMTDGTATDGTDDNDELFKLLPIDSEHYFLGFGVDHDSEMLYSFSKQFNSITNSQYYYVDSMENAGLIYGEIIDKLLYRTLSNCTLSSETCQLFDVSDNTWSNSIKVNNMGNYSSYTYHYRMEECDTKPILSLISNDNECEIILNKTDSLKGLFNYDVAQFRINVIGALYTSITTNQLYDVSDIEDDLSLLDANQDVDAFVKQLNDDIYILKNTFNDVKAYSIARYVSQAYQLSYNITKVEINEFLPQVVGFDQLYDASMAMMSQNFDSPNENPRSSGDDSIHTQRYTPLDPTHSYSISQDSYSVYATPGNIRTMRNVSQGGNAL